MADYRAPLRDIRFVCNELLNADQHYQSLTGSDEVNQELIDAIIDEAAKFSEQVLAPLRQPGDEEGCQWSEEGVTTPSGFTNAYKLYIDGGWPGLSMPEEFGGQGLPSSIDAIVSELLGQANHAWSMYPGLSAGCRETLIAHGTAQLKQTFLPKLVSGHWTGTMCLTEPQCGSDLSFLKTKAQDNGDGSYTITGTKIFISSGEHDMSENIIHVVLAKLPDAPEGTRGISLFIVPKFLPNEQGGCGERNSLSCGSLEHKMGIHGNATCVMNFDGATGYMIGEPNKGLKCMFTFMNTARLDTAMQGLSHSEIAFQGALSYALEREAGRSLSGAKAPERPADRLIVHADVRRMLLTIRAFSEGHRAFYHYLAQLVDNEGGGDSEQSRQAANLLSFLTPIAKGFMTETGLEAASIGVQVYGGHGYIREWGMEQNLRDARISTLYEGTTGIQSLDLLARKVMSDGGKNFGHFIEIVSADLAGMDDEFSQPLQEKLTQWSSITSQLGEKVQENPDELGAASVDYLMYSGYIVLAWFWGRMGTLGKAGNKSADDIFYHAKYVTAQFYFARILPRTVAHREMIIAGADSLMALSDADFDAVNAL